MWKLWDEELDGEEECVRNLVDASAGDWKTGVGVVMEGDKGKRWND